MQSGESRSKDTVQPSIDSVAACLCSNRLLHLFVAVFLRASTERLTGIAWHPNARPQLHLQQQGAASGISETVALGTGCADGSAALWTEGGKLLRRLEGHTDRLGRVAFHPMGLHFVSGRSLTADGCVGGGCR